jgi:predicted DNA-binding antitoxin AbrB/MazE fold protein
MKTIHAIYERGIFRPTEPVSLPEGTEAEVFLSSGAEIGNSDETPTLLNLLAFSGAANDLPSDMAAQHDHYLHGTPKR